jgi:5S rRNA maturation endonuclease (ribonuclease M5)
MSGRCGFHGSLSELIYKMQKLSGRNLSAQLNFVSEHNTVNLDKQMTRIDAAAGHYAMPVASKTLGKVCVVEGGKDYSDPLVRASMSPSLPETAVEMMHKMIGWIDEEAMAYYTGPDRRLTPETITKWKLGWHPQERRVSVPQYDRIGRLVNLSGRHVPYWPKCLPSSDHESKAPKWMHSKGFDRELYLFGEYWFDVSDDGKGTVFIVEGAFDVIYLDQCGLKNVAGINGSHINKTQVDKILKWFDSAVILMDGDDAGIEASRKIESLLSRRMHVVTYLISDGRDPNQMEEMEVEDLKMRFMA